MAKKKKTTLYLLTIVLIIEVLLSFKLGNVIHIGKNPETGKFGVWEEKHEMDLQTKITEEFQPDAYAKMHAEEHHEEITIYGSKKLYDIFVSIFGEGKALSAFKLLRMLLILDIIFIFIALYVRKALQKLPTKRQILFELVYSYFEELVAETLGEKLKYYTPYIFTIFLFVWASNMVGLIPIPGFMEPTRNLNVPLGLGLMAIFVVHYTAIKENGIKEYVKGYFEPLPFLMPLEVVGVLSNIVSISFRLFGNVLGGAIIITVVSSLVKFILVPVGLNFFFGVFVGTIQAFVFTMLALSYIGATLNE